MGINIVRLQCRLGNSNGGRNNRNKQASKRTTIFDVDSLFKFNFIYFFIDIIYLFNYLFIFLSFFLSFFLFFLSFFLYLFTVNPLSSPRGGGLLISSPFKGRGAYLREGAYLIERTTVSVLHKEVVYGVEKLKYRKF